MSAPGKVIKIVEIDVDQCTRTWGSSPCGAALGAINERKCFNSFYTCKFKSAYEAGVNTLRFCESTFGLHGGNFYPVLKSVSGRDQEVNIAGFGQQNIGIGKRANITIEMNDFPDRGILTDKYWQERISGAAQASGVGYDPMDMGSFWTTFRARNPNYAGRALRVIEAHIADDGSVVYDKTRHYVIDNIASPSIGTVKITAKDILYLADDEKAVCPKTSRGMLSADISESTNEIWITPPSVADEYPSSGTICVGSEIMHYNRSGNYMFLQRGARGTVPSSHSVNDAVQLCYDQYLARADHMIRDLLISFGNIDPSYIDFWEWNREFDRWGTQFILSTTITKPTGVTKLIAEICQLGVTVWWDEVARKVRLRINRPEESTIPDWTEENTLISAKLDDNLSLIHI